MNQSQSRPAVDTDCTQPGHIDGRQTTPDHRRAGPLGDRSPTWKSSGYIRVAQKTHFSDGVKTNETYWFKNH